MINFIIRFRFRRLVSKDVLQNVINQVFDTLAIAPFPDLSVIITGAKEIKALNQTYRNEDRPTDVLSFNNEYIDPETGNQYLGDIIIAYPIAKAQAKAAGATIGAELELLTVHGMLHLLGYDHSEPEEKAKMWQIQDGILQKARNISSSIEAHT